MSLPSQSPRAKTGSRNVIYRRRRRRGLHRPVLAALGLVVVGGLIWGMIRGGDGEAEATEAETTAAAEPQNERPTSAVDQVRITQGSRTLPQAPATTRPTGLLSDAISGDGSRRAAESPVPRQEQPRQRATEPAREAEPRRETTARRDRPAAAPENASAGRVQTIIEAADRRIAQNDPVAARQILSRGLAESGLSEIDRSALRGRLTSLNETLVFSPRIVGGDPMVESYTVQSGDSLSRIASRREVATDWRFIQRVNGISDPRRIRVGQQLKLVRGPFHAVVRKGDYRLDLYQGPPDVQSEWTFIRSFRVGLGEDDGTPSGSFVVARNSKVENPSWVNPRNPAERYGRDDPDNPIGDYWIGIDGLGDDAVYVGYGLHGTIEPESIGRQMSLGCVRLFDEDIRLLFEMLEEGVSLVHIEP